MKKLIRYISNNVDSLILEDRIFVFNKISSYIDYSDIYEEGTGIRIFYKKMSLPVLKDIAEFIKSNIHKTQINLDTDED